MEDVRVRVGFQDPPFDGDITQALPPAYLVIDRPRRNETGFREPRECAPPYSTPVVDACFMLFGGMVGRQGPTPLRLLLFFFLF